MSRQLLLESCKKCTKRQMDFHHGLVCSLTGRHADFVGTCPSFNFDATAKISSNDALSAEDGLVAVSNTDLERLLLEQNYPFGLLAALAAGLIGAVLWGVVTVITNYQIGYMAIAIGAGVGYSMRYFGKGIDQVFGITGAALAVISCVIGNFLSIIGFLANQEGLGYFETLLLFDYAYFVPVMTESFGLMDLAFYGFAGYEGYKFAFREITEQDVTDRS